MIDRFHGVSCQWKLVDQKWWWNTWKKINPRQMLYMVQRGTVKATGVVEHTRWPVGFPCLHVHNMAETKAYISSTGKSKRRPMFQNMKVEQEYELGEDYLGEQWRSLLQLVKHQACPLGFWRNSVPSIGSTQLFNGFIPPMGNPCLPNATLTVVVEERFPTRRGERCNTSAPLPPADLDSAG